MDRVKEAGGDATLLGRQVSRRLIKTAGVYQESNQGIGSEAEGELKSHYGWSKQLLRMMQDLDSPRPTYQISLKLKKYRFVHLKIIESRG